MVRVRHPPQLPGPSEASVFLAGSIDQGQAPDWQAEVVRRTMNENNLPDVIFYNPRRPDWDAGWSAHGDPRLTAQIHWELDHLERATQVFFHLSADSLAPVSMLELGAMLHQRPAHRLIVVCPRGYWRSTNVRVTCLRKGVQVHETLAEGLSELFGRLRRTAAEG